MRFSDFKVIPPPLEDWVLALFGPLLVAGLQAALWPYLQPLTWILFYPAVFFFPLFIRNRLPSAVFVLLCFALGVFFFLPTTSPTFSSVLASLIFLWVGASSVFLHHKLRSTQQKLLKHDKQLRMLARHSPISVAFFDLTLTLQFHNDSFRANFIQASDDLAKFQFGRNFCADLAFERSETLGKVLAGQIVRCQHSLPAKKGDSMLTYLELIPQINNSEVEGFFVFLTDLTHLRELERDLEQFQTAVDQLATFAMTDVNGSILKVNEKFEQLTGYSEQELLGKNHNILKSGFHQAPFYQELWTKITSKQIWNGELCNKKKNGELFWLDSTIVPALDGNGQILNFIVVGFDITARKTAERERLIGNEKMASLGLMAANIAHEINNPLFIILNKSLNQIESIHRGQIEAPRLLDAFERIHKNTERINRIVKGLRRFSRNDEEDPLVKTPVKSIFTDVQELCQDKLKASNVLLNIDSPEEAATLCHPTQLSQVLLNLVNNAVDAIEDLPEKWIHLALAVEPQANPFLKINITDSGPGIPQNIAQNLMTPFFSTKAVGKGTGLGLSVSKDIIEKHGGKFYYNPQAANTQFVIEIPQAPELAAP